MRILVTGATGFIGNYIINELLNKGFEVIASAPNLDSAQKMSWFSQVNFIEYNIEGEQDSLDLYNYFNKPDKLIHLAWPGLPNYESPNHVAIYEPDQRSFLINLILHGLKDVTIVGTCFEYGLVEGELTEELDCNPVTQYGIAKNNLRINLENLKEQISFDLKWVRLFYMYGKGQSGQSLFSQLEKAVKNGEHEFKMSGGKQVRDYLPVEVVANYLVRISLQNKILGNINCCSGQPISIEQLVLNYLKKHEFNIQLNLGYYPYIKYEPMEFWGNDSLLQKAINS